MTAIPLNWGLGQRGLPGKLSRSLRAAALAVVSILAAGCGRAPPASPPVHVAPKVRLIKPELRTLERSVGQPGFIYAYEETSIYPKVPGYVQKWNVDIGNHVTKGMVIAQLAVPELVAEHQEKVDEITLDEAQVEVATELVTQREADWKQAVQTRDFHKLRYERFVRAAAEKGVEKTFVDEEYADYQAAVYAATAAQVAIRKAQADVNAARAKVKVAKAAERRVAALLAYTEITAPYDGIVVARNVNTGDYVQAAESGRSRGLPLYIVARTDTVRVFVDVPEAEAPLVAPGTPARVRIHADHDIEIDHEVTRTSRSLQPQTRTLRTEIDLKNPDGRLLPGSYVYAEVLIERSGVRAVPLPAVITIGNQNCCYLYEDGKAVLTQVETGLNDGKWIEVVNMRVDGKWVAFTGSEEVILGDLSELTDGQTVRVVSR